MKECKLRIDDELYETLKKNALECDLSLNKYLIKNLETVINKENFKDNKKIKYTQKSLPYDIKKETCFFSISKKEKELLKEFSKINNHSLSKEISYRIALSLSNDLLFTDREIRLFNMLKTQLIRVGTNINYIVKKINKGEINEDINTDLKEELNLLTVILNSEKEFLETLTKRLRENWTFEKED